MRKGGGREGEKMGKEGEKRGWEGVRVREWRHEGGQEMGGKGREKEDMEMEVGDGQVGGNQAGRERKPERGRWETDEIAYLDISPDDLQ